MHEISLIRSIFSTLETEFTSEELENLAAIDLRVGKLSNVEPVLMQNAFAAFQSSESRFEDVKLAIEVLAIEIECPLCTQRSQVEQYKFVCGNCGHPTNNVVQGTELLIHRVHFHTPA